MSDYHGHWELYGDLDIILDFSEGWFVFGVDFITSEEIVENAQGEEERLQHLQLNVLQVVSNSHTADYFPYNRDPVVFTQCSRLKGRQASRQKIL